MKEATVELYDIYDFYYIPFWQKQWFIVTAIVVATILVTLFILWFVWWRKKKPLTAWEWAHKELATLSLHKCTTPEDLKKFYFQLTGVIKGYLDRRFAWSVGDKTDHELVAWLSEQQFDQNIVALLAQLAEGAMWIKFANMSALKSQAEADLATVRAMIERTTPQPKN